MRGRARLLLRVGVGAAALLLVALGAPRFGAVYVAGGSMRPACLPGDLVLYRRGGGGVRERDMVLIARPDGARVLHRVAFFMLDGSLRTRGDANPTPDPDSVRIRDVEGVAVAVVPSGKAIDRVVAALRWCYNHVPIANTGR